MIDPFKLQVVFAGCATACAGLASAYDVRERRIPNRLTALVLLAAIVAHSYAGGWRGLGDSLAAALLGGFVFFLFHLAGGMGAGDVKLIAACSALVGVQGLAPLLVATGLAGGVFAVAVSLYRGVLRQTAANAYAIAVHHGTRGLEHHPEHNLDSSNSIRLPFAAPIALGCLATLAIEAVAR